MLIPMILLACGERAPPIATEPDARATDAVIKALCDLVKGAGHTCEPRTRQLAIDGSSLLTVEVFVDEVEDTLGQIAVSGRARLTGRDQALTSRFDLMGWGEDEAYKRGVHLWAVLTGAPAVDWFLADASRPALSALHHGKADWAPAAAPQVGAFQAIEGWTFLPGAPQDLDHAAIIATFEGAVSGLAPDLPHTVEIRAAADLGKQAFSCHVDAAPADALCAAAREAPWPSGVGWELRQTYVLVPKAEFPDAVPAPPAEDEPDAP